MASSVPRELARNSALRDFDGEQLQTLVRYLETIKADEGHVLAAEGEVTAAMDLVLEGRARVMRGEVDLGLVGPGEHVGELSLVTSAPRAATVVATGPLRLARLSKNAYNRLKRDHPQLALILNEGVLATVSHRLTAVTDSFGALLKERALPRRSVLRVKIDGRYRAVRNGTRLQELLPPEVAGHPVVAGLVNNRITSLSSPLSGEAVVEPLTTTHWEGRRIYHHSLALLLMEAAHQIDPDLEVRMGASVGFAQRVLVQDGDRSLEELAEALQTRMAQMAHEGTPLREEWWTIEEAREHFEQVNWPEPVQLLRTWRTAAVPMASYGTAFSLRLGPLITDARRMRGFKVVPTDQALILVYELDASKALAAFTSHAAPQVDQVSPSFGTLDVMSEAHAMSQQAVLMTAPHQLWLGTLGITSVGAFNQACIDGDVAQLIRVSESYQEKRLGSIADEIASRADEVKMVCIAGPSSSGKTTLIRRLTVQLHVNGIHPVSLNLDEYYVDRDRTPRSSDGDYDFEALEALDLDLLQDHLSRLVRGESVTSPHYDFTQGRSHLNGGKTIRLGPRDLLMIEGIHALNPKLYASVSEDEVYRLFVCPMAQLPFDRVMRVHASDVRLLRRIVRDRHGRNWNAAETIERWPKVRRGERMHIFPYQAQADTIFDSSLIYELSVLKVYAERYLLEVPTDNPVHRTAYRLLNLLDRIIPIYPDHVPATSLLREFIGGSAFDRLRI